MAAHPDHSSNPGLNQISNPKSRFDPDLNFLMKSGFETVSDPVLKSELATINFFF